jgi:glycosyltransferase involved in cell wall biosynthesis
MGLSFFPRGGSAQVARYLSRALETAGWSVGLVTGSLGGWGEETHAPTFFAGEAATGVHFLDYSDAVRTFAGGRSAIEAPIPMHPSFEDRAGAPDVVLAAVPAELVEHLSAVWEGPLRAAGADRADVFHLHHLTPQHEAVGRWWPRCAVVAHLHGTELKFLHAVNERAALAESVGTTLAGMPAWARAHPGRPPHLDGRGWKLLRSGRWEQWSHGEMWRDRLRAQAHAADQLVAVSPADRMTAIELLGAAPGRVSVIPNGVDLTTFRPRLQSAQERRVLFRRWLVEDPRGWDESATTVGYGEADLDRVLGPDTEATVLIYVGRFTAAKRVPLLVRAFARARPHFPGPTSLIVWGGHPGEWEGEHPVTVARACGSDGVFFAGWRGHGDLPRALAACDALVMASVDDSYPQAALEAMAVGLPVVATDSGGFPLMINVGPSRPTGWLAPADDEVAFSTVLIDAVNHPLEIARRGDAARDYARQHLSWSARVASFESVYELAIDRRATRLRLSFGNSRAHND